MKTREKILQEALRLYNESDIKTVTSRHIASGLSISAGNLHYHFKHTDDIINALYHRMSERYEILIIDLEQNGHKDWSVMKNFALNSFNLVNEYRFIFLNFVTICNKIPAIKTSYQDLMKRRKIQFINIFEDLVKNGTFRADIPQIVWESLITQVFIFSDFWVSSNRLTDLHNDSDAPAFYCNTLTNIFYPYLNL